MKRVLVEPNRYFDSVFLMRISQELEGLPGVSQAIVAMGTPSNTDSLRRVGFALEESAKRILPGDLMIAIDAQSQEAFDAASERLENLLAGTTEDGEAAADRPSTLREALEIDPAANVALISVPGEYAAREARQALRQGLHVMLFSDNVSVEDEIALKDEAIERGLLMMGPDCGTAILNGVPLGFANACRRGTVGIVGASGTGIQEISSLAHRMGGGISQAIGTGGRDLSRAVGAAMTRFGIRALGADDATKVIVVVSKAPAVCVIPDLLETLASTGKPSVVQFVGFDPSKADPAWLDSPSRFAVTLEEATSFACDEGGYDPEVPQTIPIEPPTIDGNILGLYCGGTLCQEAWTLLDQAGVDAVSNVAFECSGKKVRPDAHVAGHVLWDLGDDVFTVGRPHPMIEPALRDERVAKAGEDPRVELILVDCVIGYGAHADPARSLAEAARSAMEAAKADGRTLAVLASVTGTDLDPQGYAAQRKKLGSAGIFVAESNAAAVRMAIELLQGAKS
jgi:FdrA protein